MRRALPVVRVLGRVVRTSWLIAGVCIAMLVSLEVGLRLASDSPEPGSLPDGDPRAGTSWWKEYSREFDATREAKWKPFVYFQRNPSYTGQYINIDASGRRVTPQPPNLPVAARVFFFGGSTMWGTSQRDSMTIPAEASRRLQQIAGPNSRIDVTNFGENGYVFTQEIIELMLQLRQGNVPDVVVFFDGINDAGAAVQAGAGGLTQNESKRYSEFAMGRTLDRTGVDRGIRHDLRAWGVLASSGGEQLALLQTLKTWKPVAPRTYISADSGAREVARIYASNARVVEALAKEYGFTPLYVWQPTLHGTSKRLTKYERRLMFVIDADPFNKRLQEVHRVVPALLDVSMPAIVGARFVNASRALDGEAEHVFVDKVGHNTEAGVPVLVDSFWPALKKALEKKLPLII
ncbi:MAG: SGNH/GDSL hydrolase family protein [Gemmatimonadaceae bacterium]